MVSENTCESSVTPTENNGLPSRCILVTGAAGFIGGHVCERLLQQGHTVIGIDNVNSYYDPRVKRATLRLLSTYSKMKFVEGCITKKEQLYEIFREFQPDAICHLAAQAGVRYSLDHVDENVDVNITGTTNILEAARDFKITGAVVCASSSSVYGADSVAPFDESQVCSKPISPYAASKRCCELFGYTFNHLYNLNVTMLRFFTVYGPRGRPDMAAYRFIKQIHEGTKINRFGDGYAVREFTYISDIVDGVVSAIEKPCGYRIVNLGGGSTFTVNEFIAVIEKVVGKRAIINEAESQPGDVDLTSADQTIAADFLGFRPKVSLEEGIRLTYDWFLSQKVEDGGIF